MFKRRVQTTNHFGSGFEESLRFGLIDFVNVAAQMFDQFPEIPSEHSRYAPADLSMQSFACNAFADGIARRRI